MILNESMDFAGINAISLVSEPAIMEEFVRLSQEKIELKEVDNEKRLLMGAVLIPELRIVRMGKDGEPFNIYFSADTIRQVMELYMKKKHTDKATIEHISPVDGVQVVETWLIADPEKDKSAVYGFSYPAGTWMVTMKVYNEDVWSDYIKTGKVKGYSIEGMFTKAPEPDEELLSKLKEVLSCVEAEA